ncbi:hypothetical protein [uncultured Bilophila sp.]|uniref:hypothetical protein n=1 Tax=uncultured Bilophila sp. TaxID=529385 RepID=UPI00280B6FAA|nr:hypothetical protein [uncultured Bilophila sp.]
MHDFAGLCEQSYHVAVESQKDGGDEGEKIGNGIGGNMFHEKSEVESPSGNAPDDSRKGKQQARVKIKTRFLL